jgi:CheY-like chemotaxis protein
LLYGDTLRLAGWDVCEATDGRDALTKAFAPVPSLVITELRLPFVDGLALCDIFRRDRATINVPILIITAETRPAELNRAHRVANTVLTKPTPPDAMLNEIERLMTDVGDRAGSAAERCETSRSALVRVGLPRMAGSKSHSRFTTTTPPSPPPSLTCPLCDHPLVYQQSHIGGVSEHHAEQWDYFTCPTCGAFQYRQRTHKLRSLHSDENRWMNTLMKAHL